MREGEGRGERGEGSKREGGREGGREEGGREILYTISMSLSSTEVWDSLK